MNPLQQLGKRIVILETNRRQPFRKRTAKCGGNPGLVGQIIDMDDSSFHQLSAFGVLGRID